MVMQTLMVGKLQQAGIPYKEIECYGSQIVVTSECQKTANRWAYLLGKFAHVRGVTESVDDAVNNRNTVLKPSTVRVWRTFAIIK